MKVIFLDVDGVLNSEQWFKEQYKKYGRPCSQTLDHKCLVRLKRLIDKTDAYIVVSSTWRFGYKDNDEGWQILMNALNEVGIKDRFIGITPSLRHLYDGCCRGHEIQKWLDNNKDKNIENFVIIDDDSDMFHLMPKLAKCSFKYGFTKEVLDTAEQILIS